MIRRLSALAAAVLVAGCGYVGQNGIETKYDLAGPQWVFAQFEVLSLVNTRKTMGDHVVSWITGKDCSTPRAEREGVYCTERPLPPAPPPQVYCYTSLARPSCYSQPYNEGNDRLIGFVPASTPIR